MSNKTNKYLPYTLAERKFKALRCNTYKFPIRGTTGTNQDNASYWP